MKNLLFLFAFAATLNVVAQETVLLRVHHKIGDVLLTEQNVSQKMGAQGGMDMNLLMDKKIIGKDGDTLSIESKIKTLQMNMLQDGKVLSFDSSKKAGDLDEMGMMMKAQFAPMIAATIISKMSTTGKVLETKVEPPTPAMDQFLKQAKGMTFPQEEVAISSSWEEETSEQGMNVKTTYTVTDFEKGKVYIAVTGAVSGLGEGVIKGNLIVDIETGIKDTENIEMSINMNGGAAMTISTNSTTKKMEF